MIKDMKLLVRESKVVVTDLKQQIKVAEEKLVRRLVEAKVPRVKYDHVDSGGFGCEEEAFLLSIRTLTAKERLVHPKYGGWEIRRDGFGVMSLEDWDPDAEVVPVPRWLVSEERANAPLDKVDDDRHLRY